MWTLILAPYHHMNSQHWTHDSTLAAHRQTQATKNDSGPLMLRWVCTRTWRHRHLPRLPRRCEVGWSGSGSVSNELVGMRVISCASDGCDGCDVEHFIPIFQISFLPGVGPKFPTRRANWRLCNLEGEEFSKEIIVTSGDSIPMRNKWYCSILWLHIVFLYNKREVLQGFPVFQWIFWGRTATCHWIAHRTALWKWWRWGPGKNRPVTKTLRRWSWHKESTEREECGKTCFFFFFVCVCVCVWCFFVSVHSV